MPDAVYDVNLPDAQQRTVEALARGQRRVPTWSWNPTKASETNCAVAAQRMLNGAHVPIVILAGLTRPAAVNAQLARLAATPGSGVTALPRVPW